MAIGLMDARKAIDAARAKADQLGVGMAIVVVDDHGDLVAAARMDKARWFTADVARGKAFLTATFGRPSGDIAGMADNPFFRSMLAMYAGRIVLAQGAVPIMKDGVLQGAIGASGGTGAQDEECSTAGAAAL